MNIDFEYELETGNRVFVVADVSTINDCDCNYCSGVHANSVENLSIVDSEDNTVNEADLSYDDRVNIEQRALTAAEDYYNER